MHTGIKSSSLTAFRIERRRGDDNIPCITLFVLGLARNVPLLSVTSIIEGGLLLMYSLFGESYFHVSQFYKYTKSLCKVLTEGKLYIVFQRKTLLYTEFGISLAQKWKPFLTTPYDLISVH